MAAIFTTLFWCALQVSLFLLLAAPIYLLVRRRNPSAGTAVAASALGAVVVLSALAISPWPRWSLEWPTGTSANVEQVVAVQGSSELEGNAARIDNESPTPAASDAVAIGDDSLLAAFWRVAQYNGEPAAPSAGSAAPAAERVVWPKWIVWAIVAGVALGATHLLVSLAAVRRLIGRSAPLDDRATQQELDDLRRQLDVTRPISLHVSAEISTPATVGMLRPAIILPTSWGTWSAVERRAVLAHELAHIAGRDFAAWLVARGAVVLHFYHPLVRWFVGRLQLDQELAADDTAARLLGDRKAYLQALASLALATPHERLAGSLRTFIPTRSLLVRRVEMLRGSEAAFPHRRRPSLARRRATLFGLALLAIVVAGMRPRASLLEAAEETSTATASQGEKPVPASSEYDLSHVPDAVSIIYAYRPAEIAASPRLNPLAEILEMALEPHVPAASLAQAMSVHCSPTVPDELPAGFSMLRANEPIDFIALLKAKHGGLAEGVYRNRKFYRLDKFAAHEHYYMPEDGVLVQGSVTAVELFIDDPAAAAGPSDAAEWRRHLTGPFAIMAKPNVIEEVIQGGSSGENPRVAERLQEVAKAIRWATLATEDRDAFLFRARFTCRKVEDVPRVEEALRELAEISQRIMSEMLALRKLNPVPPDGEDAFLQLAHEAFGSLQYRQDGESLEIIATIADAKSKVANVIAPPNLEYQRALRRSETHTDMFKLSTTARSYWGKHGVLPPAVFYGPSSYPDLNSSGDSTVRVPRSWRVELLPLLGYEELYKQYRLDQPWDSAANLKVLRQMPPIYRSAFDQVTSTNSSFFAVVGTGTVFENELGTAPDDINDGPADTLLYVEAKRDIPWTKPEDIVYVPGEAIPPFGGWLPKGEFFAGFCDGNIRVFSDVAESKMKHLIEMADGSGTLRDD
ncbi:M56 family metallopeptidase [Lacipirellula sp.]|uniref:M56 family metallopeptidase n=1 Tax=Lacipirellula sp. TaxID=2691419 RepID=UPI003D1497B7